MPSLGMNAAGPDGLHVETASRCRDARRQIDYVLVGLAPGAGGLPDCAVLIATIEKLAAQFADATRSVSILPEYMGA